MTDTRAGATVTVADVPPSVVMSDHAHPRPELDVLEHFGDAPDEPNPLPGRRGLMVTSAGFLAGAVLGCVGFVSGLLWAVGHEPDLGYDNLAVELLIKITYAVLVGAAVASVLVALGLVAAGFLWIRHRTGRSNSVRRLVAAVRRRFTRVARH